MGRAHEVRKAAMAKTAAAKSKLNNKFGKLIYMAAKNGGSTDISANLELRRIVEKAKKEQVSADVIKRALDKVNGNSGESYIAARYEGFAQGGSMVIIDCLSDNANRTFAEVRARFTKGGGKMGVTGCCSHSFSDKAVFVFEGITEEEVMDILITHDLDADIEIDESSICVTGEQSDYNKIRTALLESYPELVFAVDEISCLPHDYVSLEKDDREKFERLIAGLEEIEDVQNVYHNVTLD